MIGKLTSPSIIKALLDSLEHRPNKGLGQNYLIDSNILGILIEAAKISPSDQLLEVGPGLGALTQALLATGAKLTAIEKDQTMAAHLREHFKNLPLIEQDVLDVVLSLHLGALVYVGPIFERVDGAHCSVDMLDHFGIMIKFAFLKG